MRYECLAHGAFVVACDSLGCLVRIERVEKVAQKSVVRGAGACQFHGRVRALVYVIVAGTHAQPVARGVCPREHGHRRALGLARRALLLLLLRCHHVCDELPDSCVDAVWASSDLSSRVWGQNRFPPSEKTELVLSIETGCTDTVPFVREPKHPVLTRPISYL